MTQVTIALVGISGVGKTTFLRRAARAQKFQHLTAGSLIAIGRNQTDRDTLRDADLASNQLVLVRGFEQAKDPSACLVVLDGHVVIDGSAGLQAIDSSVFGALAINALVHLHSDPARIYQNREQDSQRKRPLLTVERLTEHQDFSTKTAAEISSTLGIPLIDIDATNAEAFHDFVAKLVTTT